MHFLTEDKVKALLRDAGLPVLRGERADSPEAARNAAEAIGGASVIKALVPTGRRGKANAVRVASDTAEAFAIAAELIGTEINGHPCHAVYVEEKVDIAEELYLSFGAGGLPAESVGLAGGRGRDRDRASRQSRRHRDLRNRPAAGSERMGRRRSVGTLGSARRQTSADGTANGGPAPRLCPA